jgi:hypothetical protein
VSRGEAAAVENVSDGSKKLAGQIFGKRKYNKGLIRTGMEAWG